MKVVVSGGTGFIGRALVTSLSERGDEVVVLSRYDREENGCPGPRAGCVRGSGRVWTAKWDPAARGDWMSVVDGADAVVNLAGAGIMDERWSDERKKVLVDSRVRSTELLVEAVRRAAQKPCVLVSSSAVGYYGTKTGDRVLAEADAPGDEFLAKLCVEWEAASANDIVRTAIPRIGMVLGREGGIIAKLWPVFKAYMGGPIGDGRQFYPWIHLADCVRAIELAIEQPDLTGPFNVTAPDPVTSNEFAQAFGHALDRPAVMRVPPLALKLRLGESADCVLTGQRALPARLTAAGFPFVFSDLASALVDLARERVSP